MKKFIVKDSLPCWVTWEYEIEAEDADQALDLYFEGDHGPPSDTIIGDSIDYAGDGETTVDEVVVLVEEGVP